MKKLLLITIVIALTSCGSSNQDKAEKLVKNYLKEKMNDPSSYESVSFSPLDSTFTKYDSTVEASKLKMLVSQCSYQADSLKVEATYLKGQNKIDMLNNVLAKTREAIKYDSIYNVDKENYKGQFNGWVTIHSYRGSNAMGAKILVKTAFFFNPDITKITETTSLN